MQRERILVVDDEADIRELVEYNLTQNGYRVTCVAAGEEALKEARRGLPDAILLDLMLPGIDGLEVCRTLKQDPKTAHIPVIMLTAKGEEADVVIGLELGADDYITKPFSPRVLMARLRAVLRKRGTLAEGDTDTISLHGVVINPRRREVTVHGEPVELTNTEFRLLHFLARRPGWVFTRNQIIDSVRGDGYPVTDRAVDVQVAGLRKKLGAYGEYVETVRGVGYRFREKA